MRFQRIISAVYYEPWFMTASGYLTIRRVVESHLGQEQPQAGWLDQFVNQRPDLEVDPEGIAHIHVLGALAKNLAPIEKSCGNTDYNQLVAEIDQAERRDGALGILFHINSPGGAVSGNTEVAQRVAAIGVPTATLVDELCASAAYNIAASTGRITAPASASVGSIGTIIPWIDESGAWEKDGYRFEPITNSEGDLKSTFHGPSLSDDQKAYLQEYVNDAFTQFRANVQRHRDVPASAMRGQVFFGPRALENNLVDQLGDFPDAYGELLSRVRR